MVNGRQIAVVAERMGGGDPAAEHLIVDAVDSDLAVEVLKRQEQRGLVARRGDVIGPAALLAMGGW